jgi:hypothetical protein
MTARATTAPVDPVEMPDAPSANILADLRAVGESLAPEPQAAPSRAIRRVKPQTLVLVLVISATAAVLYVMRRQGMKNGFHFNETLQIKDYDKARVKSTADEVRILAELARSTDPGALPPEKIQTNPFLLEHDTTIRGANLGDAEAARRAEQDRLSREQRQQEIMARFNNIILTSVMEGPSPRAIVSGNLVKVGDTLEDFFTVAQIHDRSMDLLAEGKMYTVRMNDNAVPSTNGKKPPRSNPLGTPQIPR